MGRLSALFLLCFALPLLALPVPTTLNDFFMPGSQPNQSGNIENIDRCSNCHSGYDEPTAEPWAPWQGSMMAQAMRDPHFLAAMTIANQDAPQSGDLCIRCHAPKGWLEGRSVPTDGSALTDNDRQGIQCDFCHRLVRPTAIGVNPYPGDGTYTSQTYPRDQTYLGTIQIPPASANGMYIADSNQDKRGPFSDHVARHGVFYSPFHSDSRICGTCHNVSNPAFSRQPDGSYTPNAFDQPAGNFDPYTMFPVERTFAEWEMSEYNSVQGVFAPQFGGNLQYVRTCQDCHMRDITGHGCDKPDAPLRANLPFHDMTGGNTVVPTWVAQQFPNEVNVVALNNGIARARYMLENAASLVMDVAYENGDLIATVRVTNETGHKLPSGYPEGRRTWIHLQAFNADSLLIYESGAYDTATAILNHDLHAKIYEVELGISTALAPVVGLPAGPSFHFVVNDTVYKDNRIPPRGFTNSNFEAIQSPPRGYSYPDSQYWDDTDYPLPLETAYATATLYYQTVSKEYIEFLRDENVTNADGQTAYDLWEANGKSRPVPMRSVTAPAPPPIVPVDDLTVRWLALSDSIDLELNWTAIPGAAIYHIYAAESADAAGTELLTTAAPAAIVRLSLEAVESKGFFYVTVE